MINNQSLTSADFKPTPALEDKDSARAQIAADTEDFLARGKIIREIPTTQTRFMSDHCKHGQKFEINPAWERREQFVAMLGCTRLKIEKLAHALRWPVARMKEVLDGTARTSRIYLSQIETMIQQAYDKAKSSTTRSKK